MSYSINTFIVAGGQAEYDLSFAGVAPGYIEEDHVIYYVGNIAQVLSARVFNTATNVSINPVPADGTVISFRRETSPAAALVDWAAGQPVTEVLLDLSNTQMLYLAQESADVGGVGDAASSADEAAISAAAALSSAINAAFDADRSVDAANSVDPTVIAANAAHRESTSGNPHAVTAVDVDCLPKDNAVVYIPTADYHPATKKYADENSPGTNLTGSANAAQVQINSSTGGGVLIPSATDTFAGILTAADKVSLDLNTAKETNVTTDLSFVRGATSVTVQSSDGNNAVLPAGTASLAGVLTAADKVSLDLNTEHRKIALTSTTWQVGSTGDFATINAGISYLIKTYYPTGAAVATLNLQAGFVMQEQVLIDGIDLSWITITGTDATTAITAAALTISMPLTDAAVAYPAFGVNHGTLPVIGQKFDMAPAGTVSTRHGLLVNLGSTAFVSTGCGFINSAGVGAYTRSSSTVTCTDAVFSGCRVGIFAYGGTNVNADGVDVSGCSEGGLTIDAVSTCTADASNVNDCGGIASVLADHGSTINLDNSTVEGSTASSIAVSCRRGSFISFQSGSCINGVSPAYGVRADQGGRMNVQSADCVVGSGASANNITTYSGGVISALGATGGTTPSVNTLSEKGIIFQ